MSDEQPPYTIPPDDDPMKQDPLLQAPETSDPWVLLDWMVSLEMPQRFLFQAALLALVKTRPRLEQEGLLLAMKTRLSFHIGVMREQLREMKGAESFKVVTHFEDTDDKGRAYLAEMVYRPDGDPKWGFLVYFFDSAPGASPEFFEKLNTADGTVINPMVTKLIVVGAVLVPSSYEEYGDDQALFAAVRAFITKYVQADDEPALFDLGAAYVLYSWLQDQFPIAAYFRALGDYAAGKSTLLRTLGYICYRPIFAGGTATAAPLFRILEKLHGTLILDEADFDLKDTEWKLVLKILNAGWAQGSVVLRAEKATDDSPFDVVPYCTFGAKVLASRRAFPDPALESRCLSRTMTPPISLRRDIPLFPDAAFYQEALSLRNQLLLWRFRHFKTVQIDPRQRLEGVEPRLTANALVLLSAIADRTVQTTLEQVFRGMSAEHRQDRHDSYEGLVAQAVIYAWIRAKQPSDRFSLDLATTLMGESQKRPISGRKMGELVRRVLGLKTVQRGGTTWVLCPPDEMTALATRYAIDLLEAYQPPPPDGPRPPRTPVR
jgi:hypothetical protein